MRVNLDEQALSDPRITRMARSLKICRQECLGRLLPIWMACYQRRSPIMLEIDLDIAAELDGFGASMIAHDLADNETTVENSADLGIGRGEVYVRGVVERIDFLKRQQDKGRASGESRRKRSNEYNHAVSGIQTTLEHRFGVGSTGGSTDGSTTGSTNPRTSKRTYSPDLALSPDLTQAPDQAPDQDLPPDSGPTIRVNHSPVDNSGIAPVSSKLDERQNPLSDSRTVVIVQPAPSQRPFRETKAVRPKKEAPEQATVSAFLLIEAICQNHPESKLARASDRDKEIRAADWADTFRLMDERDKITYPEIQGMLFWVQGHNFWSQQILSANALRTHWDKLVAQRRGRPEPKSGGTLKALYDHVQDMEEKEKAGAG